MYLVKREGFYYIEIEGNDWGGTLGEVKSNPSNGFFHIVADEIVAQGKKERKKK